MLQEDLFSFHLDKFGVYFPKSLPFPWNQKPCSVRKDSRITDPEDDLGYYPDGVKRILTNDQIAIFRHSELHGLLRQQSVRDEGAAGNVERQFDPDSSPLHTLSRASNNGGLLPTPVVNEEFDLGCNSEDDEEEYQNFLAVERERLVPRSSHIRARRSKSTCPQDRSISTRRLVRELDKVNDTTNTLDYDDYAVTNKPSMKSNGRDGKRMWWPRLGS